ncbi:TRAP transporter small permease [Kushneria phosphatilytica]|uniref:TRAP transporter small permease protein n=1 Tax=Kushneria phosphatilytica TaxID=657387 RepID=A0A1S1NM79_9GAMM|nr:TRAP transporter small permease [Kushneria phosphatilytica]OHV08029.1 C4-dicarboxylate ABC transporter permease [Kushneria phosphatilytica]QEL09940.1 TRAP transporter small permease [Kushneria phosphatilytica]
MKTVMKWLDRFMALDEVLGSLALFALFLVAIANVIMRYFFDAPIAWAEEILQLLLIWATFLGASALVRRNDHVLIELFGERLPPALNRWRERLFNTGLVLVSAVIMVIWGLKLLPFSAYRSTPMLQLSYYWIYLAVPLSAAIMIYHSLRRLMTMRGM